MNINSDQTNLIKDINNLCLDFQNVYSEHLDDSNGEFLMHLLVADYTRLFATLIYAKSSLKYANGFLEVLENALINYSQDTIDIIYISFIENLNKDARDFIKNSNYSNLKHELNTYLKLR